jgi:hypothetical protein
MIYLFTLAKCVYWFAHFDVLLGEHSIFTYKPHASLGFRELPLMLYNSQSAALAFAAVALTAFLCLAALFTRVMQIPVDILLWILVLNLHFRTYGMLTGGDNLHNQYLFFNIALFPYRTAPARFTQARNLLHNAGVTGILIQTCMMYLFAGLAKVIDPDWQAGRAVSMIMLTEHYTLSDGLSLPAWLLFFLNHFVMAYQVLFPVLVWIRKIKPMVLGIGLCMHLYIIFGMGLASFGTIMIIGYVLFLPSSRNSG